MGTPDAVRAMTGTPVTFPPLLLGNIRGLFPLRAPGLGILTPAL